MAQKYENSKRRGGIFLRIWEKYGFVQKRAEDKGFFCIFAAVLKTNN